MVKIDLHFEKMYFRNENKLLYLHFETKAITFGRGNNTEFDYNMTSRGNSERNSVKTDK